MKRRRLLTLGNLVWLVIYISVMTTIVMAANYVRTWAIDELGSGRSKADWETWREETEKQEQGEGPVTRRKAVSDEPPTLVLMRDHFVTCLGGLLLMATVLFFTMMVLFRGAMSSDSSPRREDVPNENEKRSAPW